MKIYRKITFLCKNCNTRFIETDSEKISEFIYLLRHDAMKCPLCGSSLRLSGLLGIINPKQEEVIL